MFGPFDSGNNYNDDNYNLQYYPKVSDILSTFMLVIYRYFAGAGLVVLTRQQANLTNYASISAVEFRSLSLVTENSLR